MNILSIQSAVTYGHVGNSAAVFPLQRLGFEVWAIDTLRYSNHPGYGRFRGRLTPADLVDELMLGLEAIGVLPSCNAVLTGYLGDGALAQAALTAVARVKAANPKALYCCDPVIGDRAPGVYVRPELVTLFAGPALAAADILTPNLFELEQLAGGAPITSREGAIAAARSLAARGPRIVLVTSLEFPDEPADRIGILAVDQDAAHLVETPRLDLSPNGSGDAVAALFLGHMLKTSGDAARSLEATAAAIFAVLETTLAAGTRELQLIAAQDVLVEPPRRFSTRRVG